MADPHAARAKIPLISLPRHLCRYLPRPRVFATLVEPLVIGFAVSMLRALVLPRAHHLLIVFVREPVLDHAFRALA